MYAVSSHNDKNNSAVQFLAAVLGYFRVPEIFAIMNETDAEQIILNYAQVAAILRADVDTPIAPSRNPCGLNRQNCAGRIVATPGVRLDLGGF